MIQEFVQAWDKRKGEVEAKLRAQHPKDYKELVQWVVEILDDGDWSHPIPDPYRIFEVDLTDSYEGEQLYVIVSKGCNPSSFWYVKIRYGSCSCSDTLLNIRDCGSGPIPNDEQVAKYMTLALHILQGMKVANGDKVG